MVRWVLCGFCTAFFVAALSPAAVAGGVSARPRRGHSASVFSPGFHRLANDSTVLAVDDERFIGRLPPGGISTSSGTLVNVVTGARRAIVAPRGCAIDGLTATVVVFDCSDGTTLEPDTIVVEQLASGRIIPLVDGGLAAAGRDWIETSLEPPEQHSTATLEFVNVTTGQQVPDFGKVGSSVYADLNSPHLRSTACRPVTVTAYSGGGRALQTGGLVVVGRVVLHTTSANAGPVIAQVCGSRKVRRFGTSAFAVNNRIVVWVSGNGVIEGLDGDSGKVFTIRYPQQRLGGPLLPTLITLNSRDIYVQTANDEVWATAIPRPLR